MSDYAESNRVRQRRYRQRVRVENETRGNAMIMPVSYKKDVPVQVWMESRYLATLSVWLDANERTKYLSEVVQEGIRVLVDHLVRSGEVDMVDDSVAARDMLRWKYRIKLEDTKYGSRGKNNTLHNAVLTEQRREIAGSVVRGEGSRDMREIAVHESRSEYVPDEVYEKVTGMSRGEIRELDRKLQAEKVRDRLQREPDNTPLYDPSKPYRKDEATVDVEENVRRMKEADEKLEDM